MCVMYLDLGLLILAHNDSEQISALLYCISEQKLKNSVLSLEMFLCVTSDSYF